MPEINKRQAYVIDEAQVLPNPNGSAVGMMLEDAGKFLVVLPGPPREMMPMFETHVLERLRSVAGNVSVVRRILRVAGIGESAVDELIAPIYKTYPRVQTSILFNRTEIEIHLSAAAETEQEAAAILDELAGRLAGKLGSSVFAMNGESMEEVIGNLLKERSETVAVAESCTGGLIGMRLTELPGSSAYFLEGAVTYSNEAKIRTLGVSPEILNEHGAVSRETAEAMAKGMRGRAGTDYAIAVTGIAGPDGGTDTKPVGTVFIGYSDAQKTRSLGLTLPGDRYLVRWRSSQAALEYLRRQILKIR
jgi:nicotinamide-nucleotide amidase